MQAFIAGFFGIVPLIPVNVVGHHILHDGFAEAAKRLRDDARDFFMTILMGAAMAIFFSPFDGITTLVAVTVRIHLVGSTLEMIVWAWKNPIENPIEIRILLVAVFFALAEVLSLFNPMEYVLAVSVGLGVASINTFVRYRAEVKTFPLLVCLALSVIGVAVPALCLSPFNPVKTLFAVFTGIVHTFIQFATINHEPVGLKLCLVISVIGFALTIVVPLITPNQSSRQAWSLWDMKPFDAVEELLLNDV